MREKLVLAAICFMLTFAGCSDGDKEANPVQPEEEPYGVLLSRSDCKELVVPAGERREESKDGHYGVYLERVSGEDCVEYGLNGDTLSLKHINAAFNCCPEEIMIDASVIGDTIVVTEREKEALCDCLCLYDLKMAIYNVSADAYTIVIKELYLTDEDEPIIFTVDLAEQPEGKHCVKRNHYPW